MGSVTLQGGETLQSLAQGAYGDASLWYLIAQANGLTGNNDLHVGETLIIPSAVASSNNASTFKPYDAGKVVGDTTPNLPLPPADNGGCGGLMAIILIIIIIVIIIYTSGAGAEAAGGAGATGDAAAVTVVDEFGAIVANSAYAAPANFGTLFLQGAGMNLAGQVLSGKEEIDWGGVLLGGVGGVIGGGIDASGVGGQGLTGTIVRGALKSAINQGLQIATGRQKDFNWTGVAASGLGAGLGHALGDNKVFDGLGPVGGAVMRGIVTGAATTLMSGGKVSLGSVATDAFGAVLGAAQAGMLTSGQGSSSGGGGLGYTNQMDMQSDAYSPDNAAGGVNPYAPSGQGLRLSAEQAGSWFAPQSAPSSVPLNALGVDQELGGGSSPTDTRDYGGSSPSDGQVDNPLSGEALRAAQKRYADEARALGLARQQKADAEIEALNARNLGSTAFDSRQAPSNRALLNAAEQDIAQRSAAYASQQRADTAGLALAIALSGPEGFAMNGHQPYEALSQAAGIQLGGAVGTAQAVYKPAAALASWANDSAIQATNVITGGTLAALAPDMVSGARDRQLERGEALVSLVTEAGRTLVDPIGQWGRASSALSSRFEGQVNQYASGDTYGATMAGMHDVTTAGMIAVPAAGLGLSMARSYAGVGAMGMRLAGEDLGVGVNSAVEATPMAGLQAKWGHLPASERAALLESKAEANAFRRLIEMEQGTPKAHYLEKHGAQLDLQSQFNRAAYGINPTTGQVQFIPPAATRFLSNRDQLNVINRAENIFQRTGDITQAQLPIRFNSVIGDGYQKGTLNYGVQYTGQVYLNSSGKAITAFPAWGK